MARAKVLQEVAATCGGRRVRGRMMQGKPNDLDSIGTSLPSTDASSAGASFLHICVHVFNSRWISESCDCVHFADKESASFDNHVFRTFV